MDILYQLPESIDGECKNERISDPANKDKQPKQNTVCHNNEGRNHTNQDVNDQGDYRISLNGPSNVIKNIPVKPFEHFYPSF